MNIMKYSVFLFFLSSIYLLSNVVVEGLEAEGIVGGDAATPSQFPYQVAILINGEVICGGGIIDKKFILSAAHCFVDRKNRFLRSSITVVAGTEDLKAHSPTRVEVDVEEIFIPIEYVPRSMSPNQRSVGDIAVLQLREELDIEGNSNLDELDFPEEMSYIDKRAEISGFGWDWITSAPNEKTNQVEENGGSSGKMRHAEATVLKTEICNQQLILHIKEQSHICARVDQRKPDVPEGVCYGDSGSPLVVGKTVIGVLATSPHMCRENESPAVYTRVSSYLEFVCKVVEGQAGFDFNIRSTTLRSRH